MRSFWRSLLFLVGAVSLLGVTNCATERVTQEEVETIVEVRQFMTCVAVATGGYWVRTEEAPTWYHTYAIVGAAGESRIVETRTGWLSSRRVLTGRRPHDTLP